MKSIRGALLAFLALGVAGCDGGVGPEGPPGPPGPPGRDAVVFARPFDFSMEEAQFDGPVASVAYDAPDITLDVVEHGAVLVFFREQETWTAMPYTFAEESPNLAAVDFTITLGYAYEEAVLEVFYEASTDEVDLSTQPDRKMKLVVIGGFAASKAGVDLTDYEAVAAHFGLED